MGNYSVFCEFASILLGSCECIASSVTFASVCLVLSLCKSTSRHAVSSVLDMRCWYRYICWVRITVGEVSLCMRVPAYSLLHVPEGECSKHCMRIFNSA